MGIHSGPVYRVTDINDKINVAGIGINMAQRVMDCGDEGHIIVSRAVAEVLGDLTSWTKCIHDLGEVEVKHGVKVQIFNLYSTDFGNSATPQRIRSQERTAFSLPSQIQTATEGNNSVEDQIEPVQVSGRRQQVQRSIAQEIISALYEAWSKHTIISLNPVQEQSGADKGVFRTVVDKLEKGGLIRSYGTSYTFEITPAGIFYAEEHQIVPKQIAAWHEQIRKHILTFLAELYDRQGSRAHEHYEKIAQTAPVKDRLEILKDLSLLTDLGYVDAASISSFRITDEGLCYHLGADYEEII